MAKMRIFKFWNESGQEEEKETTSFKKAVKSIQENFKNQLVGFEYISKKGKKRRTTKFSSMNKSKKRSWKAYNGQGR